MKQYAPEPYSVTVLPEATEPASAPSGLSILPPARRGRRGLAISATVLALALLGTVTSVAAPAFLDNDAAAEATPLRLTLLAGTTETYTFDLNVTGSFGAAGMSQHMGTSVSMTLLETVVSVNPEGGYTIDYGVVDAHVTGLIGTEPIPVEDLSGTSVSADIDAMGAIRSVNGASAGSAALASLSGDTVFDPELVAPTLPVAPVAIGDSWTSTVPVPMPNGDVVDARVTTTYLGDRDVDGVRVRVIEETLTMPLDVHMEDGLGLDAPVQINGHYQGTAEFILDPATNDVISGTLDAEVSVTAHAGGETFSAVTTIAGSLARVSTVPAS